MDIARPERKRKKRIRQLTLGGAGLLLLVLLTAGLTRLEPAAPSVARASVWVDTVKKGEMLREVRGTGTLVPHEIRWIAAQTDGRVERVVVRPGAEVTPETVLVEMTNPDLEQQTETARYALEAAQAELTALKPKLRSQQLDERAALAAAQSDYRSAQLQAEAEKPLAEEGIVPDVQYQRSKLLVEQLATRVQIEQQRLDEFGALMEAQLGAQHAQVEQARNVYERRLAQVESLKVRAGLAGVLQQVLVEAGQRVALGANIARVARPDDLQAELKIPETQARDVQLGQRVSVDTRNGVVDGRVARIDPAVQGGTVQVDVELTGALPPGARPDLSVDGTIEIERLNEVVYTGRPAYGQSDSTISLFKLVDDGDYAVRVPVKVGRTSVNAVEIEQGLEPGDQVILSDTSQWDDQDRIRLN